MQSTHYMNAFTTKADCDGFQDQRSLFYYLVKYLKNLAIDKYQLSIHLGPSSAMKKKTQGAAYVSPTRKQQPIGLKKEFIYEVLGQEETFKKQKSQQNLTKLIYLYRKLVEYYSSKGDPISEYFLQKMSTVSSEMPNIQEPDERLTMSMAKEVMDDQKNANDPRFKAIITTPVSYDPELKKKERSKNAQITIEVNKIKKRANARTILKSYYEEWEENNKIIVADLKNQRKQLEDKLLAIHKKSLEAASKPIVI